MPRVGRYFAWRTVHAGWRAIHPDGKALAFPETYDQPQTEKSPDRFVTGG